MEFLMPRSTRRLGSLPLLALSLALPLACADDVNGDDAEAGSEATDDEVGTEGTSESSETGSESESESETTETGTETETETETDTESETDTETGEEPSHFQVGVDIRNLDPTQAEQAGLFLGGYGAPFTRGVTTGVHDSIYARTMAVGLGDDGVILSVVDAVGMGNQWTREIRQQAAAATGLSEEQIIISTTHTHSGPDFQGLWGGVSSAYRDKVIDETVDSMASAWADRVDANLSAAAGTADNRNRRDWGFTDDELFVLEARSLADDALLGTLLSFAAHPVILPESNKELSRDYCGYVVDNLEADTGGPVLFFNGILGDVSPDVPDGMYADDFEEAAAYGELVATEAALALEGTEAVEPILVHDYAEWDLPVDNALFNLAALLGILQYDFDGGGGGNSVTTQTTYLRLGEQVQLIAFPGESLTRNGLPVKEAMTAPYRAVLGNSGDALGYFVPSDEWQTGLNDDYEESVSLGQSVGDTTQGIMVALIGLDTF
ncbi:hypothetical protein PPSIR1_41354 [Plesiocystis pacifica SIR-1]|uniref:Neutral/alkaline non-lysosomal ceramidase N-terminal domain-containing protein n=2 Tax=Plesiocystis pacifica TaxID=191768 RepID=A6GDF9_9BACT|nr:hypothetical protein PPSIR1_41354 [Plesiocystis pacifica SIR-1]